MPRKEEVNQRIRDKRSVQILEVAAKLIGTKGLAGIQIGELAKEVGMSQGLLYRYFPNKEEVFYKLVEQAASTLMLPMQEALQLKGSSTEKLYWLTEQMLQSIRKHPGRHQIIGQALALPGKTSKLVQEMGNFMHNTLHQLILEGQAEGKIVQADPNQLVVLYLSSLQGLAVGIHLFGQVIIDNFPDVDSVFRILKP